MRSLLFLAAVLTLWQTPSLAQQSKKPYFADLGEPTFELGMSLVRVSRTEEEADLDEDNVDYEENATVTVTPQLGLNGYVARWWAGINVLTGKDAVGGGLGLGYLINENVYLGGVLAHIDINTKTEIDEDGGNDIDVDRSLKIQKIGPVAIYRDNNAERLLQGFAGLMFVKRKGEVEVDVSAGDNSTDSEVKYTAIEIGGSYHRHIFQRLAAGVGASYSLAINGDAEVNDADGDFDRNNLTLELLNLILFF